MTRKGALKTAFFAASALTAALLIADGVSPGPLPTPPSFPELETDFGLTFCPPPDPRLQEASAITLPEAMKLEKPSCIPLPEDPHEMKARPLPPAAPNDFGAPRTLSL